MKTNMLYRSLALAAVGLLSATACDDYMEGDGWTASAEQQMDEYLASQENLSLFLGIIDQAELRGMVHAYGTYTLFAPDNAAVITYLGASGEEDARARIASLEAADARSLVKYHMIGDTLHTYDMQANTRLSNANMELDYLVTSYNAAADLYTINRTANIVRPDVHNGNGIIHVVDGFLSRPTYTIASAITDSLDVQGYGIIGRLVSEVLHDYLDQTVEEYIAASGEAYLTFVAQPDKLMEADGITSVDALIELLQRYNIKGYDVKSLLTNWVGYHFMKGRYYLSDIKSSSSITTLSPLGKAISVMATAEKIYLNRFEDFGDPGIGVVTDDHFTDFTTRDGVIQSTDGELQIIERAASRINWDMADVAEIRSLSVYRKAGQGATFYTTNTITDSAAVHLSEGKQSPIYWYDTDLSSVYSWYGSNSPNISYYCDYETSGYPKALPFGSNQVEYVYGDYLNFRLGTTVIKQLDIRTPTLVEGTYKVWVRLRRAGNEGANGFMRMTFMQDGEEDQTFSSVCLANYGFTSSSVEEDEKNAAKGQQAPGAYYPAQSRMACHMLGTIKVVRDGVHTLRWTPLDASQSLGQYFDMIYYIPVDNDQVLPRVMSNGEDSRIYRIVWNEDKRVAEYDKSVYYDVSGFNAAYRTHIWPYICPVVEAYLNGTCDEATVGSCTYPWCPNYDAARHQEE